MEQEIIKLEKRVAELMAWKDARTKDRLTYPIDIFSRIALDSDPYAVITTGKESIAFHNSLETDYIAFGLTVYINNHRRAILCSLPLNRFTVVAATNVCTNVNGNHNLLNGDYIFLTSSGTLPSGLNTITAYYIIERTGTTFKLSLTLGGSAVDITDIGTGDHYWAK